MYEDESPREKSIDWLALIIYLTIIAFIVLGFYAVCADHKIQSYYMREAEHGVTCVMASVPWDTDYPAYCTQSASDAVLIMYALQGKQNALKEFKQ